MKLYARRLRRQQTDAEKYLWRHLRSRHLEGFKFRRQHTIAPYIVDFICLEVKLIIEVDGGQHAEQQDKDTQRTNYLNAVGYRMLRFWNHEILTEIESVLEKIRIDLIHPSPQPSPLEGRGS